MLRDTRIDSSNITSVVDGVINIYMSFNYVVAVDDDDSLLMCVLVMQNGDRLTRNLLIDISVAGGKGGFYHTTQSSVEVASHSYTVKCKRFNGLLSDNRKISKTYDCICQNVKMDSGLHDVICLRHIPLINFDLCNDYLPVNNTVSPG